ncbi:MAG: hypothetical protein H6709_22700 [Kofleriaceae bacterium]|nr:hypothetical protein [Myxococcales bacterium]MCB9559216.1 hypothetical protein [Kofleriaceae bacterium]MCB9574892.1 hypothetical protein [Kofleriaceae bacterium]
MSHPANLRVVMAGLGALALAGCTDQLPGIEGTQSLKVELVSPADPGSVDQRLPDDALSVSLRVQALDEQGQLDTSFTGDVDVYVQFLGSLTPELGRRPLATIPMTAGESAVAAVDLPPVFGPTFMWVEDGSRDGATYATGTSPTLWYRDPYLADISTPDDEAALDALSASPLESKQVTVDGSRYGANGRIVVTGVYAQGYTVSDVECADADGTPPCTTGDYDHVLIYSFSRPKDEQGRNITAGQFIDGFAGAVEEFNGLTEIGFPQSFVSEDPITVDEARIPPPAVVQESWLTDVIEFERRESGLVEIDDAVLCDLDNDYATYKQWKLDIGRGCGAAINVITAGVIDFEPADYVGQTIPKVVGTLRPVNIGSFNVWIIYPRSAPDLTLP